MISPAEKTFTVSNLELAQFFHDRPNLKRYMDAMDSSLRDKVEKIVGALAEILTHRDIKILSVGPGTGSLERSLAEMIRDLDGLVIAADLSQPMLEKIRRSIKNLLVNEDDVLEIDQHPLGLEVLQANATELPIAENTLDAIILSSVVHEIASFENDHEFGEKIREFFIELVKKLKPKGRIVIRDFIQPPSPSELIDVTIGEKQPDDPMDPLTFFEKFTARGAIKDSQIAEQVAQLKASNAFKVGATIRMPASEVFEYMAHFSWAQSFDSEVKEKYAYLPLNQYSKFVLDAFQAAGKQGQLVQRESYLQEGYPQHILGRFNLKRMDGSSYPLPDFTGLLIFENVSE